MSRPAESPGGLVNTEPALRPPGWFSLRHRTIPASVSSPAPDTESSSRSTTEVTSSAEPTPDVR